MHALCCGKYTAEGGTKHPDWKGKLPGIKNYQEDHEDRKAQEINSLAKTLTTEILLELRPTKGWLELEAWTQPGQLPAKTKISKFPIGFKHDPKSHCMHLEYQRDSLKLLIV